MWTIRNISTQASLSEGLGPKGSMGPKGSHGPGPHLGQNMGPNWGPHKAKPKVTFTVFTFYGKLILSFSTQC